MSTGSQRLEVACCLGITWQDEDQSAVLRLHCTCENFGVKNNEGESESEGEEMLSAMFTDHFLYMGCFNWKYSRCEDHLK
jgi:hypothetical protein